MASDSEGLRHKLILEMLERQLLVENGFRFGRVTTQLQSLSQPYFSSLKMASDSEGLRPNRVVGIASFCWQFVENGFRFGRVTTWISTFIFIVWLILVENGFRFGRVTTQIGDLFRQSLSGVENGFRFGRVTTDDFFHPLPQAIRWKWLPIRKGYD